MKRGLLWIPICLVALTGCGSSETADQATADNAKAMTVTTPNATAADARRELANSNLSPEAKKVIGGGSGLR